MFIRSLIISDSLIEFSFSIKNQFIQFSIISTGQPHLVAITGIFAVIASMIVIQNPSVLLGKTNKLLVKYSFTKSSQIIFHLKNIYFSKLYLVTNVLYISSWYPYQIR